jgi:hypothetical protein
MGGGDGGRGISNTIEVYDTFAKTWTMQMETMPKKLCLHFLCAVGTDIYLFGGTDEKRDPNRSIMRFDTILGTWTTIPGVELSLTKARIGNLLTLFHERKGSVSMLNENMIYVSDVNGFIYIFDPKTETLTYCGKQPDLGGRTFSIAGSIFLTDSDGEEATHSVRKGTILHDGQISWKNSKQLPDARNRFGLVAPTDHNRNELEDAIYRLQKEKNGGVNYIIPQEKALLKCLDLPMVPGHDLKVIVKTFHKLARMYHPDSNPGHEEKFKEINNCYDDFLTMLRRRADP